MAKAQRFLFSFQKFINYLQLNQKNLNLYTYTQNDKFSDEITFQLDTELYISREDIHGKGTQYYLTDHYMVIAYGDNHSENKYLYYLVNPDSENEMHLISDMEKPFVDETFHLIDPDVFSLLKKHGEIGEHSLE